MASRILQLCNGAAARARAFERYGVIVRYPALSRSGVREHDGMVVFAIEAAEVRTDNWGCSSLLWRPLSSRDEEALQHCRLAVRRGSAEGFLVYTDGMSQECEGMLALRVVKSGAEYWARWGRGARAVLRRSSMIGAGVAA
jgi:hypothetical protein